MILAMYAGKFVARRVQKLNQSNLTNEFIGVGDTVFQHHLVITLFYLCITSFSI